MRVKHIWPRLATALLCTSVAAGCGGTNPAPSQGQTTPVAVATNAPTADGGSGAYPAPANTANADPAATTNPAYPAPAVPSTPVGRAPEPIPQPSAETGVVHGKIYNATTDAPIYDGVTVFLSHVIKTSSDTMEAVVLNAPEDFRVTPDNQGGFAFANVPPGRYGIVVQGPLNQSMARRAQDQTKDIILTVEAAQTIDLGKLYARYP